MADTRLKMTAVQARKMAMEILSSQRIGVLATSVRSLPQTTLIAYASTPSFEILFVTEDGSEKARQISKNSQVSFAVFSHESHAPLSRVTLQGVARPVPPTHKDFNALRRIYVQRQRDGEIFLATRGSRLFRIRPARVRFGKGFIDIVEFKP